MDLDFTMDVANHPKMLLSVKMFQHALDLDPNDVSTLLSFSKALAAIGEER